MTKLRLSNHKLEIEAGRHKRPYKLPEERLCFNCINKMEDEKHFMMACKAYLEKRKALYKSLEEKMKIDFTKMTEIAVFILLMQGGNENSTRKQIAKYIWECFELRASLVICT